MLGITTDYFNILLNILTSREKCELSESEIQIILDDKAFNNTIIAILNKFITSQEIEEQDSEKTNLIINKYFSNSFRWQDSQRKLKIIRNYMSHDNIIYANNNYIFNGTGVSGVINKKDFSNFLFEMFDKEKNTYLNIILFVAKVRKIVCQKNKTIYKSSLCNTDINFNKFINDSKSVELINTIKYTNVFAEAKKRIKLSQLDADNINIEEASYYVYYSPEYLKREKNTLEEYINRQRAVISSYAFNIYKLETSKRKQITPANYDKIVSNLEKKKELEYYKETAEHFKDIAIKKQEYLSSFNEIMPSNWEFIRRVRNSLIHNSFTIDNDIYCIIDNNIELPMNFCCYLTVEQLEDLTENIITEIEKQNYTRVRY